MSHKAATPKSTIVVAPEWLKSAFTTLLLAAPNAELVAFVTNVTMLDSIALASPPEIVVLFADSQDQVARDQAQCITALWPKASCLALVDLEQQRVLLEALGVDQVLLKGSPVQHMVEAINGFSQ